MTDILNDIPTHNYSFSTMEYFSSQFIPCMLVAYVQMCLLSFFFDPDNIDISLR